MEALKSPSIWINAPSRWAIQRESRRRLRIAAVVGIVVRNLVMAVTELRFFLNVGSYYKCDGNLWTLGEFFLKDVVICNGVPVFEG